MVTEYDVRRDECCESSIITCKAKVFGIKVRLIGPGLENQEVSSSVCIPQSREDEIPPALTLELVDELALRGMVRAGG